MDSRELVDKCVDVCEDRKAENIVVFDVQEQSSLADYYLFCCGNSPAHIQAIVAHLSRAFKDQGLSPRAIEGVPASRWVLMDYMDVLVHVFHPELRAHYNIEGLLDGAPVVYPPPE